MVGQTFGVAQREEACIHRFLARRVDGLFIAPVYRIPTEARIYQELSARKVPTVLLGHTAPFCQQFSSTEVIDLVASYGVTRHLLQLGHKRIAFLAGPLATPWARERLEGYRRALREAGQDLNDKLVFPAGSRIEDGVKAAAQLMSDDHFTVDGFKSDNVSGQASLQHRLYDSLTSSLLLRGSDQEFNSDGADGFTRRYGGGIAEDYNKNLTEEHRLKLSASFFVDHTDQQSVGTVKNERHNILATGEPGSPREHERVFHCTAPS